MNEAALAPIIEHPFDNVKPPVNSQLPLFPDSMIHHKPPGSRNRKIVYYSYKDTCKGYGVSPSRRVLSPGLFLKKYNLCRQLLEHVLDIPTAEREGTLRLLRFWAYYGNVYPKESTITVDPGCSKATFWRAVKRLREFGLLEVVNRFILRPHAQISNLYRLDKLLLVIARYLAEHGVAFREKWLQPNLTMPGSEFWPSFLPRSAARVPTGITFSPASRL